MVDAVLQRPQEDESFVEVSDFSIRSIIADTIQTDFCKRMAFQGATDLLGISLCLSIPSIGQRSDIGPPIIEFKRQITNHRTHITGGSSNLRLCRAGVLTETPSTQLRTQGQHKPQRHHTDIKKIKKISDSSHLEPRTPTQHNQFPKNTNTQVQKLKSKFQIPPPDSNIHPNSSTQKYQKNRQLSPNSQDGRRR